MGTRKDLEKKMNTKIGSGFRVKGLGFTLRV